MTNKEKINEESLRHLAKLSKIKLDEKEETPLLADMQKILAFVEELQTANTDGVLPMNGGGDLQNVFRRDEERINTHQGNGKEAFPDSKDGYLSVPAVFKHKEQN